LITDRNDAKMTKAVRPYSMAGIDSHTLGVSMYLDLLASVLDDWVDELSGTALVDYAVGCRSKMLTTHPRRGEVAEIALSTEVAYDRALVKLCFGHGVDVDVMAFAHPRRARSLLERELAEIGIDLAALSQVRHKS
jgi:hypothetical protein